MSTIRFIHTDFLRLACPVEGISSAPGWLQEALTDATRRATRQTIETAISENVDFLLIAGSPTDSAEDLEIACAWLDEQLAVAGKEGIQIVAVADNESEASILRGISDIVVDRHQYLLASESPAGTVRLATSATSAVSQGDLVVSFDDQRMFHDELSCHYNIHCRHSPAHPVQQQYSTGIHSTTAGPIQSCTPDEQWNGACLLVSADITNREIQTRPVDVSSLRFVTEQLTIEGPTSPGRLVEEIAMASRNLQRGISETLLVDWVITASIESPDHDLHRLEQSSLLASLRTDLHSGHQGVWPRSIRFTEAAELKTVGCHSESERLLKQIASAASHQSSFNPDAAPMSPELICGLTALQDVA